MADFYPLIIGAVVIAGTIVAVAYVVTNPYIVLPLLALIAFFTWRGYKRRRV